MASERTRPSQPFGGRTFRMNAMVRARSTTSESPYLPALIQFGPYIASGTFVSYDHGEPWVEAYVPGFANRYQFGLFITTMSPLICWCQARITCLASLVLGIMPCSICVLRSRQVGLDLVVVILSAGWAFRKIAELRPQSLDRR